MYADGREALIHLGKQAEQWADSDMSSILPIWSSMYSSMSVMVNQATCYHRDINGWDPWYDMLVTVGDYLPLDFVIPMLNLQLHYNPGTIIAIFRFSIGAWGYAGSSNFGWVVLPRFCKWAGALTS
ncbi:hypothetical protein F5J12DRAFT_786352 [Pisolithus orientalis]|uniref:uncharacterized protein n=1 Tax=Pisolithus orientalis TaxID=936130 RepID=UPI0022248700|nr:uncharacterized protein F5J12DRAFT_786352 [Pisolithus orientalis]KAI5991274.1 hypothetical protein F5J12DRAFT_786352 [Pisolithus orientalis]